MATGSYRGNTVSSPVSPFSFQGSSVMQGGQNPLRQHPTSMAHPRYESRSASTPTLPVVQTQSAGTPRPRPSATNPSTPVNSTNSFPPLQHSVSTDDSVQKATRSVAPLELNLPSTQLTSYANVAKASPDRYRRNHRRAETAGGLASNTTQTSAVPSGSGMASVGHLYSQPNQISGPPAVSTYPSYRGAPAQNAQPSRELNTSLQSRLSSQDDMNVQQRQNQPDLAKRYRRRSISSLEAKEYTLPQSEATPQPVKPKTYAAMLAAPAPADRKEARQPAKQDRPPSSHGRNDSIESANTNTTSSSAKSSSAKRAPDFPSAASTAQQATPVAKNEAKVVNVPARGSSEANKRLTNPSPLSKPLSMSPEPHASKEFSVPLEKPKPAPMPVPASSSSGMSESPAAQQLAALSKKEAKKEGKSSRLRRAFSFGSAAELRKASTENNANAVRERNKLQKSQFADEEEEKQAAIAQQQEAAGLGESIYSGQGHFFTGSTDNLSISSTASSASMMIRKMGKGVKKGSKNLVGLFRPKSVVGVPAADSAVPEPSVAQVSMVTVEAEREKVNVNVSPHDQPGGGTGFPKLERNSIEATAVTQEAAHTFSDADTFHRRSIVGGERERAEVLAAVKKGILKRTDSSNSTQPTRIVDSRPPNFNLPQIPRVNDSPNSSAPSTPVDERPRGHGKSDSVHIEGEEYFLSIQNYANGSSSSVPGTPGRGMKGITFSPRIVFHDTWPPGEYDRRGEIATCNRLTPMLAQQIKEELNSFKMV
ncbi:uncharacterized protein KY384_006618 [Bacidia gigantensis]|uniref:uncharacterized protein n=1 Tax=Bacidia gigantensis TaxID=2732470 RepID=UPI001D03AD73|nr:uncharacterized protein KY384_006618 [Bacidia gigantensis]KAG8528929.1 hypothetical protein KY384_006618 [Bacidia gigantensis]